MSGKAFDHPWTESGSDRTSSGAMSPRLYWSYQFGGWGAVSALQFSAYWRLFSLPILPSVVSAIIQVILFVTTTHLLRGYSEREGWTRLPLRPLVRRVVVSSIVLAFTISGLNIGLTGILIPLGLSVPSPFNASIPASFLIGVLNDQIFLLLWMALYFAYALLQQRQQSSNEETRLRAALRTAELSLLKSQLNPHFLFNALNTVRALIVESPDRAQLAVTQLARTLRYSLNSSRDEIVSLENELEIVNDYLGIETLRLAERLTIVREVADDTLQTQIPIMLLQTLVENAVKHGISQLPQGGTLRVAARMDDGMLVIEVTNDRPLIKSGSIPSDRVGLANANERLRLMIGSNASLTLDLSRPQLAKAVVRIPQLEKKI